MPTPSRLPEAAWASSRATVRSSGFRRLENRNIRDWGPKSREFGVPRGKWGKNNEKRGKKIRGREEIGRISYVDVGILAGFREKGLGFGLELIFEFGLDLQSLFAADKNI